MESKIFSRKGSNSLNEKILYSSKTLYEARKVNNKVSKLIQDQASAFPKCSDEYYKQSKKKIYSIYIYANRCIEMLHKKSPNDNKGWGIVDENGVLLKLHGSEKFNKWAKNRGITEKTFWDEDSIGTNAVAIGIQTQQPVSTIGTENFLSNLKDTAIYYHPIIIEEDQGKETNFVGGLMLIMPMEFNNDEYHLLCSSIVFEIELQYYTTCQLFSEYAKSDFGFMAIDISMKTGMVGIAYYNEDAIRLLGLPKVDFRFKRASTVFDPLPANQEFWNIINKKLKITDKKINVYVRNKKIELVLSTRPYHQDRLNFMGIYLHFTSPQQITEKISKSIGNNAFITFDDIIGNSRIFKKTINYAKRIANSNSNILIQGESGTGKDVLAQAIHNASSRRDKPFIALNCAAFPRDLIASELFGYEGGAFTGSKKSGNLGKFELANQGTLFLDEIGDMPLDLQAVLLRAIEQKSFIKIGSNQPTYVDVKIIAATNINLLQRVQQKMFRADLYYRLSTLNLTIPPLRKRGYDIILLAEHFARTIMLRVNHTDYVSISDDAKEVLMNLPWNGNVRELQNLMEGIIQIYSVNKIEAKHIHSYINLSSSNDFIDTEQKESEKYNLYTENTTYVKRRNDNYFTREQIEEALIFNKYNKSKTAKYLGISRKTLYRWMDKLGIS